MDKLGIHTEPGGISREDTPEGQRGPTREDTPGEQTGRTAGPTRGPTLPKPSRPSGMHIFKRLCPFRRPSCFWCLSLMRVLIYEAQGVRRGGSQIN